MATSHKILPIAQELGRRERGVTSSELAEACDIPLACATSYLRRYVLWGYVVKRGGIGIRGNPHRYYTVEPLVEPGLEQEQEPHYDFGPLESCWGAA